MEKLKKVIVERLEKRGMDLKTVPSFVRDVMNVSISAMSDLKELNRRLSSLGWHDYELDDHTFQIIKAIIEEERFNSISKKVAGLDEDDFSFSVNQELFLQAI